MRRKTTLYDKPRKSSIIGSSKSLHCLEHDRELTHVCSELDCLEKPLFCEVCLEVQHLHLSEHGTNIILISEFIELLEDNPEYRSLRKINWLMDNLKEIDYIEKLDAIENKLRNKLEEDYYVFADRVSWSYVKRNSTRLRAE